MANDWEFIDNSAAAIKLLRQAAELGLEKAANVVEGRAKARAPVRYGALRDHLSHRVEVSGKTLEATVGSPHKYAIYVEKGTGEFAKNGNGRKGGWVYKAQNGKWYFTRGQKPQSFLEPAFLESRNDIQQILGSEFKANFGAKGGGKA